jgi:hypothetical protein
MKVYLTGGLGNQLFQLAAANDNTQGEIELVSKIGKPRLNEDGEPEIASFALPDTVSVTSPPNMFSQLTMKVFGLILRAHFNPRKIEKHLLFLYRSIGNIYISLLFKKVLSLRVGRDVGYTLIKKPGKRAFLVGYFQSFKYLSNSSMRLLSSLNVLKPSNSFLEYLSKIQGQRILVIHVRIGDYLNEPTIGTISKDYYKRALAEFDFARIDQVLVFTDSPELVSRYLPEELTPNFEVVPNTFTSAETLMLMKAGNHFIISNSTFSWWGAMLSQKRDKKVVGLK